MKVVPTPLFDATNNERNRLRNWLRIVECEQHAFFKSPATGLIEASTRGANFAAWFGNSRVVDADGKPLVVYHGTNQTFKTFSKKRGGLATGPQAGAIHGFFFTNDRDEAWEYARNAGSKVVANVATHEKETERLRKKAEHLEIVAQRTGRQEDWLAYEQAVAAWEKFEIDATREDTETNVQVIAAYLSIQNPLEVDFHGSIHFEEGRRIEDVVEAAVSKGHDGAIMRNIADSPVGGRVSDHYVVFSAKQIRRA